MLANKLVLGPTGVVVRKLLD